jgi:hypothetical protein
MSLTHNKNALASILPEPELQLTAKIWIGLTKVSKQAVDDGRVMAREASHDRVWEGHDFVSLRRNPVQ